MSKITHVDPENVNGIGLGEKVPTRVTYEADLDDLEIVASTQTLGYRVSLRPSDGSEPPVLGKKGTSTATTHLVIEKADGATPVDTTVRVDIVIGPSRGFPVLLTVKP